MGNYFTTKQLRAFRIPVISDDGIELSLHSEDQQIVEAQNIVVRDISLSGVGFVSPKGFELGQKIEIKLGFADYLNLIDGIVVRSQNTPNGFITGIVFEFDEGESFDSFFQKFIKRFSAKRLKSELFNLLKEQNYSTTHASELLILNEIQAELIAYGNSPVYFETLVLQLQQKLEVESLDLFIRDIETGRYKHFKGNGEEAVSYEVRESVLEKALETRSTVNALIVNDVLLASDAFITNFKNKFILCEPVTDMGGRVVGFSLASRSNQKYKYTEAEVSLMKLFAHEAGRYIGLLKNNVNLEPVKFLNPKKPREFAMIGGSVPVLSLRKFISQTKADLEPVFIKGAVGSGRNLFAKIVHSEGKLGHTDFLELDGTIKKHIGILDYLISSHRLPLDYKNTGSIYIANFNTVDKTRQIKFLEFSRENKGLFRVIVSTQDNKDLDGDVIRYFKNSKIKIPTLNDRREDIPLLVNFLIRKECKKRGYLSKTISRSVLDKLKNHDWKGNIRELKTVVSRLVSWYSSSHFIDTFPPESYQVFEEHSNSEFDSSLSIEQVRKLTYKFSSEEMVTLVKWGIVVTEMQKHDNNLKKTALALGKPHEDVVSIFEAGESLIATNHKKKAA